MVAVRHVRTGRVIDADDQVAQAWVASGRAELIEPEKVEAPSKPENPEQSTRRRRKPETR